MNENIEALKLFEPRWYARMTSPRGRLRTAYSRLFRAQVEQSERVAFLTVNVDPRTLYRSGSPLALELAALRKGSSPEAAYTILWNKFFTRFRNVLLRKSEGILTVIGTLENAGYTYDRTAKQLHLHALIPVPANVSNDYFRKKLTWSLVRYLGLYPARPTVDLEFIHKVDVELADYHGKQLLNPEIASDRLFLFTSRKIYTYKKEKSNAEKTETK